jgi:hypothetical protein
MLALYQMMGFRRKGTGVFSLTLERTPATPSWIEVV